MSQYEIKKILEVALRHEHDDEWAMVAETHKLPEWKKNDPGKSVRPIPLPDILEAVGRQDDLDEILEFAHAEEFAGAFFERLIKAAEEAAGTPVEATS